MMKFALLFLSFIFSSSWATDCSVHLYSKIYRLDPRQALNQKDIVISSDCSNLLTEKVAQIISSSSGTLGSDFLKAELNKEFPGENVTFSPRKLSLLELNPVLRDQLSSNSNLYFFETKSLNGLMTLGLVDGEQIRPVCESCNSFGEKNIKIDIVNPITSSVRTLWFTSKLLAKIKVYKAKRNIGFQERHLESEDFYAEDIYSQGPENLLTSIENIQFFKAARTIVQGSPVSNMDLQPVNLVSYGTPVNVLLKNNNINLQRTAMPVRSARLGEIVELKNPHNNRIIAGKVVDYNKVVIEL